MKRLCVKVFTADRKIDLEKEMNAFLTTVPESFLRDLGFSHSVNNEGCNFYSAMIVYEERYKLEQG